MRSDHEELLNWSIHHLVRSGIDHPESDAQIIYDEIIKKNEGGLYIKQAISRNVIERFKHCIKRRASREPINYILGRENFWSMEFQVTPDVLIPRRETELLIKEFSIA